MEKRVLILEDNLSAAKHIERIVAELDVKAASLIFSNINDAYRASLEKHIDVFVVDIILDTKTPGDSSGLKFVDRVRQIKKYEFAPVVIVTALEDERLYSYEKLHCYSFVEKPFDDMKLKVTLNQLMHFPTSEEEKRTLYYRKDGIILTVDTDEIVYAETRNHIMNIHTRDKGIMSIPYLTVGKLLNDVDGSNIIQCSRNAVVNIHYIENIDITNRVIQLEKDYGNVEIGVAYKKKVKEILE